MNRKKAKRKRRGDAATRPPGPSSRDVSSSPAAPPSDQSTLESSPGPGPAVRTGLSIWVAFHLLALLISFTSVVEPSALHARLASLVHPYLRPTHFSADDRPVYLAHGDASEQPHRLQVATAAITDIESFDDDGWRTVMPQGGPASSVYRGLAVSDRNARWLSTAAMLAETEQPSLVAELLLPIARQNPGVTAIRIIRLTTDLNDIDATAESPYVAKVSRRGDSVTLVQLQPARLSSQTIPAATKSEAEGAGL